MSEGEYIIDGYTIVATSDGVQMFKGSEWLGSKPTRQEAVSWVYKEREARIAKRLTPKR